MDPAWIIWLATSADPLTSLTMAASLPTAAPPCVTHHAANGGVRAHTELNSSHIVRTGALDWQTARVASDVTQASCIKLPL